MSAGAVVGRVEGGGGRRRKRRELTEEQKQEIGEAFALFDSDKDQALDYHELKVAIRALGFDVKKADVQKIMNDFDKDDSGKISLADFTEIMTDWVLKRDPREEILKAFQLFDEDKTGIYNIHSVRSDICLNL
ncbi:Centrin-3 [Geodia barretti]|uniref:Centrin-3 n=1 Tax=Geodia barretti TaxID=519541 RepID=A0AA35SBT1_GEOBA|nr:Centrin-3 [Geodia barretti]